MEMTNSIVNQLRLSVIDEGAAKRFWSRRSLGQWQHIAQKTEQHHTVYLDTPAHGLTTSASALAIHAINQSKQTIALGSTHTDSSDTHDIFPLTSGAWPHAILIALAKRHVDAHLLVPIMHVVFRRYIRKIQVDDTHELATLWLDQGIVRAGSHHASFCDITVMRSADTTSAQLDDIMTHIQQAVPCITTYTSPLQRGLQLLQHDAVPADYTSTLHQHISMLQGTQRASDESLFIPIAGHDDTPTRMMAACALQLLAGKSRETEPFWLALDEPTQHQVEALIAQVDAPQYVIHGATIPLNHLPFSEGLRLQLLHYFRQMLQRRTNVLSDFDANHIHRMRVVLRKIRALLDCADSSYDDELLSQYKRGFRRMARFLGEVRGCDVLADNIARISGEDPVNAEIARTLTQTRTQALRELIDLFNGDKHHKFISEFATFVCTPEASRRVDSPQLRVLDVLGNRIAERALAFQKPLSQPFDRVSERELHDWRIRGKQLRYILECFPAVIIPATAPALAALDAIQHTLGLIQDVVVAFELLNKMKVHTLAESKKIMGQLRQEAITHRQALPQLWQDCTSSAFDDAIIATIKAIK